MNDNSILLSLSKLSPKKMYFIGAALATVLGVTYIYQKNNEKKEKLKRQENMKKKEIQKAQDLEEEARIKLP